MDSPHSRTSSSSKVSTQSIDLSDDDIVKCNSRLWSVENVDESLVGVRETTGISCSGEEEEVVEEIERME